MKKNLKNTVKIKNRVQNFRLSKNLTIAMSFIENIEKSPFYFA